MSQQQCNTGLEDASGGDVSQFSWYSYNGKPCVYGMPGIGNDAINLCNGDSRCTVSCNAYNKTAPKPGSQGIGCPSGNNQENYSQRRENYTPCCRPQPYLPVSQTWGLQKPYTL